MQIGPANPVLQTLAGAQETGNVRQQAASARADSARAISALARGEQGRESLMHTKRDAEEDDRSKPKPRGSLVDVIV